MPTSLRLLPLFLHLLLHLPSLATAAAATDAAAADETLALLQRAGQFIQSGDYDTATFFLDEALLRDPDHFDGLHLRGVVQYYQGNLPAAEAVLRDTVQRYPKASNAYNTLGEVLRAAGRPGEAIRAYATCIDLERVAETTRTGAVHPRLDVVNNMGLARMALEDHKGAALEFELIISTVEGGVEGGEEGERGGEGGSGGDAGRDLGRGAGRGKGRGAEAAGISQTTYMKARFNLALCLQNTRPHARHDEAIGVLRVLLDVMEAGDEMEADVRFHYALALQVRSSSRGGLRYVKYGFITPSLFRYEEETLSYNGVLCVVRCVACVY